MGSLVIVAIPAEDEVVWKVSSEKVPHMTLMFLGEDSEDRNMARMAEFVDHALTINQHGPFYLPVDYRDELGPDKADVLFFEGGWDTKWIKSLRGHLLQQNDIRAAYEAAEKFPDWVPHLTLGYPETPAKKLPNDYGRIYGVQFDKIAVWNGNYEGPEFRLKWPERDDWEEGASPLAMSTTEAGETFILEHVGVKGMHWGVRKEAIGSAAKSAGRSVVKGAKAVGRFAGDVAFESETARKQASQEIVDNASTVWAQRDIPRIKAKPKYQEAKKLKNRLRNPLDQTTRDYRSEMKTAYIKRLEKAANEMKNVSGDRQYTIRERGGDLPNSKYFWEVHSRQVQHASDGEDFILLEVQMDDDGFFTGLNPVEDNLQQTIDLGQEFLEHFGVKGMRWGQRKQEFITRRHQSQLTAEMARRAKRPAQDIRTVSTIGQTKRNKSSVGTAGGEDHPPTEDAIKVAEQKQKYKKSGAAALTNNELQDLQRRLNLEGDVQRLMRGQQSSGQRFVEGLLGRGSKDDRRSLENRAGQQAQEFLVKKGAKKAARVGVKVATGI